MNHYVFHRWILLTLFLLFSLAQTEAARKHRDSTLDSLLHRLYTLAPQHDQLVRHYESELYIKGRVHPVKTNRLIQSVPQTMRFQKGVDDYIVESYSELNYNAPWIFDRKVLAVNGTFPRLKQESSNVIQYFNVTLYKETLIGKHLLSPFLKQNARFYNYTLDSIKGNRYYLSFEGKYSNTQLVDGKCVIDGRYTTISEVELNGYYEFMKFRLLIQMGVAGYEMMLPISNNLHFVFSYLGNKVEGEYISMQRYKNVELINRRYPRRKHHHDITDRFKLQVDTNKFVVDSALIARHRLIPLTPHEEKMYRDFAHHSDSLQTLTRKRSSGERFLRNFGQAWVSDYSWRFSNNEERIKMSPILNPVLLEYSKSKGYSYRIDLRYTSDKPTGRMVTLSTRLGYNFTFKEWLGRVNLRYLYWPKASGSIELEAGSGRRLYTDAVLNAVKKSVKDSIDFDKLNLGVFTDNYVNFKHKIEIVNGMDLTTGVVWHRRIQTHKSEIQLENYHIRDHYSYFALHMRLDYTPGQYYYWNKNRKVDEYSPFPTFSVDWEHAFPKVFGSNGMYDRWEVEMNYSYKSNVLNRISYNIGAGIFAKKSDIYFPDFNNFRSTHVPEGWDDRLSGRFRNLRSRWYNRSDRYLRGHITYESPLLALSRLHSVAHAIQAERLYLSGLITPDLKPYIEVGWGFTTHVIDIGVYSSFQNGDFAGIGGAFRFMLFRKRR